MKYLKPEEISLETRKLSEMGNPGKPEGETGVAILERMNVSHYEFTSWALELTCMPASENVLDIGCGGGLTLKRLSAEFPNSKLVGLDYSEVAVKKTSELNSEDIASGKMRIIRASIEEMPFEDESFDFITSFETFYFWPDRLKNILEVKRVMKKGAVFILASEAYAHEGLSANTRQALIDKNVYNPSYEDYEKTFKQAGFAEYKIYTKKGTDWIAVIAIA